MIGQRLGSFLIEEQIGSGAMGVVFRALYEKTNKPAAVKIITNEAGSKVNVSARFGREADILKQFRHPNIVRYLANGRYQGTNYIAMEYLTGGTLEDVMEKRGALPWREAVDFSIQICDALHYAHQRNVIHRDLKPSNLLLSDKGQLKLTDFGIAKDLDAEALTATGRTLGTAAYMAPEQIRGEPPISHKTDLYALGCLMYQMLCGEVPFKGSSPVVMMNQHLNAKAPRPSLKADNMPRALDDLVHALMAKDVTKRPWDAEKVRFDLEDLLAKVDRGEDVPMVFTGGAPERLGGPRNSVTPGASPATIVDGTASAPTRAPSTRVEGTTSDPTRATKSTKARKPKVDSTLSGDSTARREQLKSLGLAGLLVATAALIVYLLWPPGAASLYADAQALMKSEKATDWTKADREFLSELDRRFPDRYVEEKRAWRDKIGLHAARGRATVLEKPLGQFSLPKTPNEERFLAVFLEATGASKSGDDEDAAARWREMADDLAKSTDPVDRPWGLLAKEREAQGLGMIARRRETVLGQLDRADRLVQEGKIAQADELRADIAKRYGMVRSLKGLIRVRTGIDPDAKPEPKAKDSDEG